MKPDKNIILVPTDFSKVADNAVNHAVILAKTLNGEITILHIVPKKEKQEEAKEKTEKIAADILSKHNVTAHSIVRIGNIFDDIGDVAKEIGAKIIIMGTHGVKGFQHITGSYAMKVITNSSIPFIVVQTKIVNRGYNEIVLPLDLNAETKHKISVTAALAKYFNSKIHIIATKETDEHYANTIKRNLGFTKSYLDGQGVSYTVKIADEKGNFTEQVLNYANAVNADLIAIVSTPDAALPSFLASDDEQDFITNEAQIPVLCVNAIKITVAGGVLGN